MIHYDINWDVLMTWMFNGGAAFIILWAIYWMVRILVEEYQKIKQPPREPDSLIKTQNGTVRHRKQ
jgi:hypothetical protein